MVRCIVEGDELFTAYDLKINSNNKKSENKNNGCILVTDQIRELAKLKDEGILTEEEFAEKKKTLLEKIC